MSRNIKWSITGLCIKAFLLLVACNLCICVFLFQALEAVNAQLRELYPDSEELFDIVLVTYNHAHVGIRLINTINHHSECPFFYP